MIIVRVLLGAHNMVLEVKDHQLQSFLISIGVGKDVAMTMAHSIRIMLPILPVNAKGTIYLKGYLDISTRREIVIYITEYSTNPILIAERKCQDQTIIYGYCCEHYSKKAMVHNRNFLELERSCNPQIKKLIIDGEKVGSTENCIIMLYDLNRIHDSETICSSSDYFSKLQAFVHGECQPQISTCYEPSLKCPHWLSSSMFIQHLFNYLNLVNWLICTICRDKKVSIKPSNLILAIVTDILLGCVLLEFVTQDKKELSSMLMGVLENLVNFLYSLLKWIMGAPAGLKLNNAFNQMLGNYFSYHIQLWGLFLDVSGEKLDVILHIYHYVGYLGFTFQAAMISDMISVATFHSYCIYVYAARLFNIQISGLIALLRLFVGRKYNPLRGGIDSCEYTNQELFVGTVAFTILLLLLPTTVMYYIVFTLFRLLSLVVQYTLARLIYLVQTLPLYVVMLWLARSSKVAGNILIETVNDKDDSPLVLKVKLFNKSLGELVNNFRPPVESPKQFEWTNVLSNAFIGKQMI